jgi:hypothetical protein
MLDMVLRGRSGLTRDILYDILKMNREHPDMTHMQIATRMTFKHKTNVSRQAVTDLLNGNRHRELRNAIDAEQMAIEQSGNVSRTEENK